MLGNVTALEGSHVTWKYRDRSIQHTCSRHLAWGPESAGPKVQGFAAQRIGDTHDSQGQNLAFRSTF